VHPRKWRAFMEYGNGIVGDMCIHMLDMVRWMMDLGWPTSVASTGGILVEKQSSANISDTQEATFDFPNVKVVWTHRTWGQAPDPKVRSTVVREGNFDYLTNSVRWDHEPKALPNSLYLTSKPAFFGDLPWPWVDPTGATKVFTLPAQVKFNSMVPSGVKGFRVQMP